jgi:hypothetical protein
MSKICINGKVRDMTPEEIAAVESQARLAAIAERSRPMTEQEVSRMFISQQINTLAVDDNTALRMKGFYPAWTAGITYDPGFKVQYKGKLWRVVQAHTSQATWEPDSAASLWETINETHTGTVDDPIPYDGNMRLEADKHYFQNGAIYLCTRDTGNPVYNSLSELVGIYVEIV